ncbi:MAG: VCBS repeat-containing protein [Nitrospirae bacterium]|nr:VCBS repeat-containing protein [Nitrospirota bacterium]
MSFMVRYLRQCRGLVFAIIMTLCGMLIAPPTLFAAILPKTETISLSVDVSANRKAISPYIYGLNFVNLAKEESFAREIDLPVARWGGNSTSRYNWKTNNTNAGSDWYFENVTNDDAADYTSFIDQNIRTKSDSLLTIPMIGYIAKDDKSCGFSIAKYGAQQYSDYWRPDCGNGISANGSNITGNDPLDTSIAVNETYMQDWVKSIVTKYGNGGVKFYTLDNEPELWSSTHRDVHPTLESYDELYSKTVAYATAIKAADATAKVFGYVSFGWTGYWRSQRDVDAGSKSGWTNFPDLTGHNNLYQVEFYLDQMHKYEQKNNVRLLDYLDLHYYPENGVALTTAGDASTQALRLRCTRSLWDPTYKDESWIGGADQPSDWQEIRLIPRMHAWVDKWYPGTRLAITEYNFGGLEDINGALAQADVLGIFGREGLYLATLWDDVNDTQPGFYAFRIYRNYDGSHSKFGETSILATSSDQSRLAIYAAQRSADNALTMVIINKTANTINGSVAIANFTPSANNAQVYRYSSDNLNAIVHLADQAASASGFSGAFPANSITLVVVPAKTCNPRKKDFDGDGKSDLLWQNAKTGDVVVWLMNGSSISQSSFVVKGMPADWDIKAIGDFSGDSKSDVLWQNSANGDVYIWGMDGTKINSNDLVVKGMPSNWQFRAAGDLNGDCKADVLWQDTKTGDVAVWFMDGAKINSGDFIIKAMPSDWTLKAVADLNNDGKADMIWQAANGDVYIWLMDGSRITGGGYVAKGIPGNWQIKAVDDFDGDGKNDILWQDTQSGDVAIWLMDGSKILGSNYVVQGLPHNWQPLTTGDFNGDGKADVLCRDTSTGDIYIWLMDGFNIKAGGFATRALELDWATK